VIIEPIINLAAKEKRDFVDKLLISGGKPLFGTVEISGAKNAALPARALAELDNHEKGMQCRIKKINNVAGQFRLRKF